MVKIIKNTHWSVYAFALSVLMAGYSIISILTLVEKDLHFLLMHAYLTGFFGFIAYLTKPIFPPRRKPIEEQEEFISEQIEDKRWFWANNQFNFYFLMLGGLALVLSYYF